VLKKPGSPIAIKEEGTVVADHPSSVNFVGAAVTATASGDAVTVTLTGNAITAKDEGVNLTTALTSVDFVGAGVTATNVSGAVTVTVPGASAITSKDEGVTLTSATTSVDFVGAGVTATNVGGAVTVTVPDGSAAHIADTTDAHDASAISLLDDDEYFTATEVEGALAEAGSDLGNIRGYRQAYIGSVGTEAANAIVVSGLVSDLVGNTILAPVPLICRTLAITADKGDMTVITGTLRKAYSPAAGVNELWMETDANGAFAVSVANDQAEITLFTVTPQLGMGDMQTLTFT
jgi:hypothetical protein